MAQFSSMLNLQGQLFLLMLVGFVLWKLGIADEKGKKFLTDFVIDVTLPCNIIQSFRIEFNLQVLKNTLSVFLISLGVQFFCLFLTKTAYRRYSGDKQAVLQYGTVCSNSGFLGNPLAEGIFGSAGTVLASIYLVPIRIVMWSAGLSFFLKDSSPKTKEERKAHRKSVLIKTLTHPCIVATIIGMTIMLLQLPLPVFLGNTVKSISSCNTAVSLILIGMIMGGSSMKNPLDIHVGYYCLIRLGLIPLFAFAVCKLLALPALVTGISVVLAAMPMGGTTAILAAKYNSDAAFASKCVAVSTLLSLLTTPLWCLIL